MKAPSVSVPIDIGSIPPYGLDRAARAELHGDALAALTAHHYDNCAEYRRVLDALGHDPHGLTRIEDVPFIPVRLFKEYELRSVSADQVVKTMMSSGTSGQQPSRIFLDKRTAADQTKVLARLMGSYIGTRRMPMLIVDSREVVKDRAMFSARGAGILGFSMFGSEVEYALNANMALDVRGVSSFLEKHAGENLLVFGFTFVIWQNFYAALKNAGIRLPLETGTVIHGGGWKKLTELQVDNERFKRGLREVAGIERVFSYYGMVEQTGSIFVECEAGFLHTSGFSDVLVRDFRDFAVLPHGEEGLLQLVSLLPYSYPGHSVISEDRGRILGEDDCTCGRLGKRFEVLGRIKDAEIRGCSDVAAAPDQ